MNIFQDFTARIEALLAGLGLTTPEGAPLEIKRFAVEPPRDATHGDLACNAAMVLAKSAGQNPRALAEAIAAAIRNDADVAQVDVAGPGFINIRLNDAYWQAHLASMAGLRWAAA